MGPYYDNAVEIHQEHLRRAEDNRLRRLAYRPRAGRSIGSVRGLATITLFVAVMAFAGQLV